MKQFFLALALLIAGDAMALIAPQGKSTNVDVAGAVVSGSIEQWYINVINKQGSTISAGKVVFWDVSNDDGASVVLTKAQYSRPACMVVADCAANALCKCQKYGYTSQLLYGTGGGSAVAGECAFMNTSTAGTGYVKAIAAASVNAKDVCLGMFYDAASATGAVEAFLNIP